MNKTDFYYQARAVKNIPSLIKWTGSKRSQVSMISGVMPPYKKYIEPFLGSGAMLFSAGYPGSIGGDVYAPLIDLWNLVKKDPQTVIEDYKENWDQLQSNLPGHFYVIRDRFNKAPNPLDLSFLMRTCVNGIVRFNKDGLFNNSFHLSRKGMLPEMFSRNVKAWNIVIKDIEFVCQDYAITLEQATKDDFIYLDPPYSCNKQRYVQDLDVDRLWSELNRLNSIGVKWALSFDGSRGTDNYEYDIPRELYKYSLMIKSGNSAVDKVLNGPIKEVHERLYLNYTI